MADRYHHVFVRAAAVLGVVLASLSLAGGATPARAAGVVTDCTGTGLANAMNAGSGLITFDCGPTPVVINVAIQLGGLNVIAGRSYTIDGGDKITLTGANTQRLFDVQANGALTLTHITLINGLAASGGNSPTLGGAILAEGNSLVLDHVTLRGNHASFAGGAIRVVTGTVSISDSLLENNQAGYGGAIDGFGALTLSRTIVRGNQAATAGGGLSLGGLTTIDHSQIYSNTANGVSGGGGGLYFTAPSRATIRNSQVTSNTAAADSAGGGGIQNFGTLTVTQSSLSANQAFLGGGLSNESTGQAALDQMTISGNLASSYSGGVNNEGVLTLTQASLIGNHGPTSGEGGGLGTGGSARTTLRDSAFIGNAAGSGAGVASEGGPFTASNVTFSGNTAIATGGGLLASYGVAGLVNVTFSGNTAGLGGAIYLGAPSAGDSLTLKNTLLANGGAGGNCAVSDTSASPLASAGFNLSDDHSCDGYLNQLGDQNGQAALLFPLAANGGLTRTHLPQHASPAIDNGLGLGCPAADQRGQPRPAGGGCDIGAVEVQPADRIWPLFLPAARR